MSDELVFGRLADVATVGYLSGTLKNCNLFLVRDNLPVNNYKTIKFYSSMNKIKISRVFRMSSVKMAANDIFLHVVPNYNFNTIIVN